MYIPNPRYPPFPSSIEPLRGVYLPYLPRVVGAAPKTRSGVRQEKGRGRGGKEWGKGARREGAMGEGEDGGRDKLAGGGLKRGSGKQAADPDGRVRRRAPKAGSSWRGGRAQTGGSGGRGERTVTGRSGGRGIKASGRTSKPANGRAVTTGSGGRPLTGGPSGRTIKA